MVIMEKFLQVAISRLLQKYIQVMSGFLSLSLPRITRTRIIDMTTTTIMREKIPNKIAFLRSGIRTFHSIKTGIDITRRSLDSTSRIFEGKLTTHIREYVEHAIDNQNSILEMDRFPCPTICYKMISSGFQTLKSQWDIHMISTRLPVIHSN